MTDMPSLASGQALLMKDTIMQNTFVCQPQQRNIHGRMFGGFLMRYATKQKQASKPVVCMIAPYTGS